MKILFRVFVMCLSLVATTNYAMADWWATGYQYEMGISGTFADSIYTIPLPGGGSVGGNLPASTYPFPQLLGGSFQGTFIYAVEPSSSSPLPWPATIEIKDNTDAVISTINDTSFRNDWGLLYFGESAGIFYALQDLRVAFGWGSGSFTVGVTPSASELLAATFSWGFIETDKAYWDSWDLPITNASLELLNTKSYQYWAVPEPTTMLLLGLGLIGIAGMRRKMQR